MTTLYDFTVSDQADQPVSLHDYKGKVVLIVNTATGCGLTPQYQGLQELYDKYKDQGFDILDFPCNQFMGQAPGSAGRNQYLLHPQLPYNLPSVCQNQGQW